MCDPTIPMIRFSKQDAKDIHMWLLCRLQRPAEASELRAKLSDELAKDYSYVFVHLSDATATEIHKWAEGHRDVPAALLLSLAAQIGVK